MQSTDDGPSRDVWSAMLRGWRGRCPNCGEGRMFRAYVKVADHCPDCGEAFHHQRTDDAPAYFVILIVGHVVVPIVFTVEVAFSPSYWVHAVLWLPLTIGMSLALLQPIKGALVSLQWALRMHGFNPETSDDEMAPTRVFESRVIEPRR
ncbi:MAG: DUF983 domain-containing protein [Rhizobiales bacterium]|nr:DUF983 domain-containing protein [Hyphomicrobiales bacterium]